MGDNVIETLDLTKRYGSRTSVDHLNIHVPRGKIYGLLGRNGSGKTTTMKMILNLAKPTGGMVLLFHEDNRFSSMKTYHRIGALIENPGFYDNLTASENLDILARLRGKHRKDTVSNVLQIVGLEKEMKKPFRKYSLGMKQRLGIAAAIMHEPELLILDEPINGLDPIGIHEIRNYLIGLCRDKGTTIFISSHILSEMEQMADIIGVIHEGQLLEETYMVDLRKRNRKYAEFHVSDVGRAAYVLEREFQLSDYSVMEQQYIRLFEKTELCPKINASFVKNNIEVFGMNMKEEKLEDYFSDLIGGGEIG
ncbi:MAG: ABC transporter ATP-binding protein [Clostridium sp.]|nr:ABC transporter ATP-binding protein [Acetatifactor muris]MCM1527034.1 ABC transporter ATP-binding protein [Bacteroides sp.]MCM1562011.1 ABC transporter ATP-binding protein [Clostridium sp.]